MANVQVTVTIPHVQGATLTWNGIFIPLTALGGQWTGTVSANVGPNTFVLNVLTTPYTAWSASVSSVTAPNVCTASGTTDGHGHDKDVVGCVC